MKKRLLQLASVLIGILAIGGIVYAANSHSADFESSSSQYGSITDAAQTGLDPTSSMTFQAWFKLESFPNSSQYQLASKDTGQPQRSYSFRVTRNSAGTSDFAALMTSLNGQNTNTVDSFINVAAGTFTPGTWYHGAWIYTAGSGDFEFCLNGVSQGTDGTPNTSLYDSSASFNLGRNGQGTSYFDGLMDDVRFYSEARTCAAVAADYQEEITDFTNVVGYWKLNNDLTDATSNNNDLTNNNSITFSTDVAFSESVGSVTAPLQPVIMFE